MNVNPLLALLGGVGDGIQAVDKRHAEEDQQRRLDEQQRANQAMVMLEFNKGLADSDLYDADSPQAQQSRAGLVQSPIPGQINGAPISLDLRQHRPMTDPSGAMRDLVALPGERARAAAQPKIDAANAAVAQRRAFLQTIPNLTPAQIEAGATDEEVFRSYFKKAEDKPVEWRDEIDPRTHTRIQVNPVSGETRAVKSPDGTALPVPDPIAEFKQKHDYEVAHPSRDPNAVDGTTKFAADQKNKIIDDFARDTKKFEDVRSGWEVLRGALKNPSLATPFALSDAYARIANPGAVVRPTTQEMIENLGSLDQRVRKFAEKNINGQLPADITRDLVRTIAGMVKEHASTFNETRDAALRRGAQVHIDDLDPVLPRFDYSDPFGSTAGAGAASTNIFMGLPRAKQP